MIQWKARTNLVDGRYANGLEQCGLWQPDTQ
jgi:hypothetical protein